MKCENCKKQEAEVTVKFDTGEIEDLCRKCAVHDARHIEVSFPIKKETRSELAETLSKLLER